MVSSYRLCLLSLTAIATLEPIMGRIVNHDSWWWGAFGEVLILLMSLIIWVGLADKNTSE